MARAKREAKAREAKAKERNEMARAGSAGQTTTTRETAPKEARAARVEARKAEKFEFTQQLGILGDLCLLGLLLRLRSVESRCPGLKMEEAKAKERVEKGRRAKVARVWK